MLFSRDFYHNYRRVWIRYYIREEEDLPVFISLDEQSF